MVYRVTVYSEDNISVSDALARNYVSQITARVLFYLRGIVSILSECQRSVSVFCECHRPSEDIMAYNYYPRDANA